MSRECAQATDQSLRESCVWSMTGIGLSESTFRWVLRGKKLIYCFPMLRFPQDWIHCEVGRSRGHFMSSTELALLLILIFRVRMKCIFGSKHPSVFRYSSPREFQKEAHEQRPTQCFCLLLSRSRQESSFWHCPCPC